MNAREPSKADTMTGGERADILVVDDLPEKHLAYQVVLEDLG